jgi:hypothetical protein
MEESFAFPTVRIHDSNGDPVLEPGSKRSAATQTRVAFELVPAAVGEIKNHLALAEVEELFDKPRHSTVSCSSIRIPIEKDYSRLLSLLSSSSSLLA